MERFQMALDIIITVSNNFVVATVDLAICFPPSAQLVISSPAINNLGISSMHRLNNNHNIYIYKFTINYYPIINQIFAGLLIAVAPRYRYCSGATFTVAVAVAPLLLAES